MSLLIESTGEWRNPLKVSNNAIRPVYRLERLPHLLGIQDCGDPAAFIVPCGMRSGDIRKIARVKVARLDGTETSPIWASRIPRGFLYYFYIVLYIDKHRIQ